MISRRPVLGDDQDPVLEVLPDGLWADPGDAARRHPAGRHRQGALGDGQLEGADGKEQQNAIDTISSLLDILVV